MLVNNRAAPLFFVSPQQINLQIPWEAAGSTQAAVSVVFNGVSSAPVSLPLADFSPGIFPVDQAGQGAILISNTSLLAAAAGSVPGRSSRPAKRGEYVTIYCTGLGRVTNPPPSGSPSSANALSTTLQSPVVTIDGIPSNVAFAGLAPTFIGLYQVDVRVPDKAGSGEARPVRVSIGGAQSNTTTMAIE